MFKISVIFFQIIFCNFAIAKIPKFNIPIILARSNIHDSFNLPPLSYLNNASPVINNLGEIAFKVLSVGSLGQEALWIKAREDEKGKILFVADEDKALTDPSINSDGIISFSIFDEIGSDGIYILDPHKLTHTHLLKSESIDLQFFTYPTIDDKNNIYFRGTNNNNDRMFYKFDGQLQSILSEGKEIQGLFGSYLFRPIINQSGKIAFKMRLGNKGSWDESNPDLIALYNPNAIANKIEIIAKDKDFDPTSHFASFLNQVSLSNNDHIAFCALTDDGRIGVFLYQNGKTQRLALENEGDILNVETFSVKVNSLGHVAFRGKDKEGKNAIFFVDTEKSIEIKKIIRAGDEIPTDIGTGKILDNPHYPGFLGEIDLNDNDQIVFGAVLQNANDSKEIGEGIYLINPIK